MDVKIPFTITTEIPGINLQMKVQNVYKETNSLERYNRDFDCTLSWLSFILSYVCL